MAAEEGTSQLIGYPLQRDFMGSIRLYFQHWMWKRQLGYLLHPAIPIGYGVKVADIACGTGVWLLDLAREHPLARFDGYDISAGQFPSSSWLPENVSLSTLDILKPIPNALRRKYDVVHVGLVVLVVENDDPLALLDNLLDLLRPGGYIQWDEADFGGIYLKSPSPEIPYIALAEVKRKVHEILLASKGTTFSWVPELEKPFGARHLSIIENRFLPVEDDIALPWTLQHLMATVEFIRFIDRPAGSATEWWALYERAAKEVQHGATMRMATASIVGRKPLDSASIDGLDQPL